MGNCCSGESGPVPVTLQIYDAGGTEMVKNVNTLLRAVGTGAFHTGVEVYGKEWSFGFTNDGSSGLFSCPPRRCKTHRYRESVHMGETGLSKWEVDVLVSELSELWRGRQYDVLRRNCTHFSDELCRMLGVGPVPAWACNMALAGRTVDMGMQHVASFRSVKSVGTASECQQRSSRDARRLKDERRGFVENGGRKVDTCTITQDLLGSMKSVHSTPPAGLRSASLKPTKR